MAAKQRQETGFCVTCTGNSYNFRGYLGIEFVILLILLEIK